MTTVIKHVHSTFDSVGDQRCGPHASSASVSSSENEGIRLTLNVFRVFLVSGKKKFFNSPAPPPHTKERNQNRAFYMFFSFSYWPQPLRTQF